jgi:hypothetical protein
MATRSAITSSVSFSACTLHHDGSTLSFSQRFQKAEAEAGQAVFVFDDDPGALLVFEQRQPFRAVLVDAGGNFFHNLCHLISSHRTLLDKLLDLAFQILTLLGGRDTSVERDSIFSRVWFCFGARQ